MDCKLCSQRTDKLQSSCEYDVCVAAEGDTSSIAKCIDELFYAELDMVCAITDVGSLFGENQTVAVTSSPTAEPTTVPTEEDQSALMTMMCDDVGKVFISEDGGMSWSHHSTNTHWNIPIIVELDEVTEDTLIYVDCYNDDDGPGGFVATVLHQEEEYSTTSPLRSGFWEIFNATNNVIYPLLYQVQ